jgi:hypothetical protein
VIRNGPDTAIASPKELLLVRPQSTHTLELSICEFAFFGTALFVFTFANESYSMIAFDLSLHELYRGEFPHAVHSLFQRGNVLVIASHSRYSMLMIESAPSDAESKVIIPNELYIKFRSWTAHDQVKRVIWTEHIGVVLHLWNDRIFCQCQQKLGNSEASYALACDHPELILVQGAEGYAILYRGSVIRLLGRCLFTDGCHAFVVEEDGAFGSIQFRKSLYGHFLILSHSAVDFDEILDVYDKHGISDFAAGALEIMAYPHQTERFISFLDALYRRYSPTVVGQIISNVLYRAPSPQRDFLFASPIKWNVFFREYAPALKNYILLFMGSAFFEELLADVADCADFHNRDFCENFLREASSLGRFLRAFTFATEFHLDYLMVADGIDVFRSTDLKLLITKITEDAERWNVNDEKGTLRFFGTTLAKRGIMGMAFAVFIFLEEYPKIEALLIVNPELKKLIVDYLQSGADQKYAQVLGSILH